jgi:hypothetical protein
MSGFLSPGQKRLSFHLFSVARLRQCAFKKQKLTKNTLVIAIAGNPEQALGKYRRIGILPDEGTLL